MKLPERLFVTVRLASRPLAGAWVRATIVVAEKNDFHLLIGPTDKEGTASVAESEISSQIDQIRNLFLMDYAGVESWTGIIRLAPLGSSDVEDIFSAIEIWGASPGVSSPEERSQLRAFGDYLEQHLGEELTINAWAVPRGAAQLETATTLA